MRAVPAPSLSPDPYVRPLKSGAADDSEEEDEEGGGGLEGGEGGMRENVTLNQRKEGVDSEDE